MGEKLLSLIWGVYCVGVVVSGLYFNWVYATEHGFIAWFFLGEIVATLKAFVWPVFLFIG